MSILYIIFLIGGVPERTNGVVLKTTVGQLTVGSNPTPSAKIVILSACLLIILIEFMRLLLLNL